ncbi:hypothetical protein [Dryocola sp. BD626]|uniref:hypothetical protein n=1 Tax=Dryocola sp. BD626 TaxID=3133273 RepID=UPI003F502C99
MSITLKVHAGDFKYARLVTPMLGENYLEMSSSFLGGNQKYPKSKIASLEVSGGAKGKNVAGTAGGALVGGVLLGGFGVLVGALAGGNKNQTIFAVEFNDGKKSLLEMKTKDFSKIQALCF